MDRRILTDTQIEAIITSECVLEAKDRLATSNTVRFTMDFPTEVKASLEDSLGLDLPEQVPMRWIQGDTPSHVDAGQSSFERTHLVYLTDSEGEFHLGDETFPIRKGESFVFPHGTLHGTAHTGTTPRLMLGPMSEDADPVGAVCFGKGTLIQCEGGSVPVEELKTGMMVKTLKHGYKAITLMGTSTLRNPGGSERVRERLYVYPKENLILTGGHSVLLDDVSGDQLNRIKKSFGGVFFTEGKIRLMAMDDETAEPYLTKGIFPIYNFVLEAPNENTNYGVFANGKLVESSFPYWVKKMNPL
jgi:quercetin dioxygenase-like cupin family protein